MIRRDRDASSAAERRQGMTNLVNAAATMPTRSVLATDQIIAENRQRKSIARDARRTVTGARIAIWG